MHYHQIGPDHARQFAHLFHGYFILRISLPCELKINKMIKKGIRGARMRPTSSRKAFVNAWMRNLNGRKSGDSSKRCIFFAMSVWCIGSPFASVESTVWQDNWLAHITIEGVTTNNLNIFWSKIRRRSDPPQHDTPVVPHCYGCCH